MKQSLPSHCYNCMKLGRSPRCRECEKEIGPAPMLKPLERARAHCEKNGHAPFVYLTYEGDGRYLVRCGRCSLPRRFGFPRKVIILGHQCATCSTIAADLGPNDFKLLERWDAWFKTNAPSSAYTALPRLLRGLFIEK